MSTTLNLSELGKLKEIVLHDTNVRHYLDEKVIQTSHDLIFENNVTFSIESRFVGPERLYENYDDDVVLESMMIEDFSLSFSKEEEEILETLVLNNIKEAGGFLTLIRNSVGINVDESQIGEGVEIVAIDGDEMNEEDETEFVRIYLNVKCLNCELMIILHQDQLPSFADGLFSLNAYSFYIADEYRRSDILDKSAEDYIDSDLLKKIADMAREPLKVAIQPFVDQNK